MTLPEQLRAIADRLEAAEQARADARMDLLGLLGLVSLSEPDSTSAPVADEGAGEEAVRSLPTSPAARSSRPAFDPLGAPPALTCPECERPFPSPQSLGGHRFHKHGVKHGQKTTGAPAPVIRKGAEWFVCARCDLKFPTREACDRHQATHPPIPEAPPLRTIGGTP